MMIQMFMKENVDSFMKRNHLISLAELNDSIAICAGEEEQVYDPVTAAQAADMLLQVNGIEASFVITKRADGMVCISARSMGDVNVQLIMEKMGGGGHLANAATQIKGKTIAEVKQTLIDQLAKTEDDGNKESTEE